MGGKGEEGLEEEGSGREEGWRDEGRMERQSGEEREVGRDGGKGRVHITLASYW